MLYVKADDIASILYRIEPCKSDYAYQGTAETMVLDKQQEIADMLRALDVVEIEEE